MTLRLNGCPCHLKHWSEIAPCHPACTDGRVQWTQCGCLADEGWHKKDEAHQEGSVWLATSQSWWTGATSQLHYWIDCAANPFSMDCGTNRNTTEMLFNHWVWVDIGWKSWCDHTTPPNCGLPMVSNISIGSGSQFNIHRKQSSAARRLTLMDINPATVNVSPLCILFRPNLSLKSYQPLWFHNSENPESKEDVQRSSECISNCSIDPCFIFW